MGWAADGEPVLEEKFKQDYRCVENENIQESIYGHSRWK